MAVSADKHSPVLRGVGVLVDLVRDQPAERGLLGEPLAREAGDGVPADMHPSRVGVEHGPAGWDDVGLVAEPERVLQLELPLEKLVFSWECVRRGPGLRVSSRRPASLGNTYKNDFTLPRIE